MWTLSGNTNELGNASVSLWKSYLFFLTDLATLKLDYPEIGWHVWKSTMLFVVSGALMMALENPSEIVSHQVVPTTASGLQG